MLPGTLVRVITSNVKKGKIGPKEGSIGFISGIFPSSGTIDFSVVWVRFGNGKDRIEPGFFCIDFFGERKFRPNKESYGTIEVLRSRENILGVNEITRGCYFASVIHNMIRHVASLKEFIKSAQDMRTEFIVRFGKSIYDNAFSCKVIEYVFGDLYNRDVLTKFCHRWRLLIAKEKIEQLKIGLRTCNARIPSPFLDYTPRELRKNLNGAQLNFIYDVFLYGSLFPVNVLSALPGMKEVSIFGKIFEDNYKRIKIPSIRFLSPAL